jgi:hypothetical protein
MGMGQGPPKYSSFHYYFLPIAKQSKGLFKQSKNKAKGWFPIAKGFFFSFLCFFLGGWEEGPDSCKSFLSRKGNHNRKRGVSH